MTPEAPTVSQQEAPSAPPETRLDASAVERRRRLLLLHFLVCSLGLIGAAFGAAEIVHDLISIRRVPTIYNDWVLPMLYRDTPRYLLFYGLVVAALAVYYGAVRMLVSAPIEVVLPAGYGAARERALGAAYFGSLAAANAAVLWVLLGVPDWRLPAWPPPPKLLVIQGGWALLALLPFYPAVWASRRKWNELASTSSVSALCAALLLALCAQIVSVFAPYLLGRIEMMNEFMDIPGRTRLAGEVVDNTRYINEHAIAGLLKYDPRTDRGASPRPRPGTHVPLPKTEALRRFIAAHPYAYHYDDPLRALIVNRGMLPEERIELSRIVETQAERDLVERLAHTSNEQAQADGRRVYDAREMEFLRKNQLELHWQVFNRWVIHHHNFVLGPINEYALGKPLGSINLQYGMFNVVLMRFLLEATGGVTYQNYFRVWYAFWPLYLAIYVGAAFLLLKEIRFVLLSVLLAFGSILLINYQTLFLGPGLNPIRRFFDLLVLAGLVSYLRSGGGFALFASLGLALAAIVNNRQFGLFLTAALAATLALRYLKEGRRRPLELAGAVAAALAGAAILKWGALGHDSLARYYLEGLVSPPLSPGRLYGLGLVFAAMFSIIIRFHDSTNELKYAALFLVLYAQASAVYFVWGASNNHLLNIAPVLVLAALAVLRLWIEESRAREYRHLIGTSLCAAALAGFYFPSAAAYYRSELRYRRLFSDHPTFQWELGRARFKSTMDPALFSEAVGQLRKHSTDRNAVHIISKYDAILPFLAGKYSAMPFFELSWFLVTEREVRRCVDEIRASRPELLFVDSDIERSLNGEIVPPAHPIFGTYHDESLQRVQRLSKLKRVFDAVKADYEPLEPGGLLTVYKRTAEPR